MGFEFSPHIAVQVKDHEKAVGFYRDVLGMNVKGLEEGEAELGFGPVTFHVEESPEGRVFFELRVADLDEAVRRLEAAGCRISEASTPEGSKSCFAADPYGMRFHVFQES